MMKDRQWPRIAISFITSYQSILLAYTTDTNLTFDNLKICVTKHKNGAIQHKLVILFNAMFMELKFPVNFKIVKFGKPIIR